jgi:hypothetical protein
VPPSEKVAGEGSSERGLSQVGGGDSPGGAGALSTILYEELERLRAASAGLRLLLQEQHASGALAATLPGVQQLCDVLERLALALP